MLTASLLASLLPAFEWLQHTYVGETIRHSSTLIALVEIVHLIGLAMLLGTILMVDLTMLGLGIGQQPISRIAQELNRWTMAGLAIMLASGPFILASEAVKCYKTPAFWIKMALLAVAIIFHFTIHRKTVRAEPPAERSRAELVAILSLALWFSVALAGKGIAIFQPA